MRVLVVGSGFGGRVVAPIYRNLGLDVEIVSARDPSTVQAAYDEPFDLISVHSPPFLHLDHVTWAVERGCAVLCDKPFGLDPLQSRLMRDRASAAGVLNFLNFEFREHPCRKLLKTLLDGGEIGALEHVSWSFFGKAMRSRDYDWRADASLGGGWIGAYGSHAIDLIRWLYGSEVKDCGGLVHGGLTHRRDETGAQRRATAEVGYSAYFVMENGGTAAMDTNYGASVSLPQRITLFGETGSLEMIDDVEVVLRKPRQKPVTYPFARSDFDLHEPGLTPWLARVRDAIVSSAQISPSFDDGVAVADTMQALRERLIPTGHSAD